MKLEDLEAKVLGGLQGLFDAKQNQLEAWPALQGTSNTAGNADIDGMPGWVWVRMGNEESLARAFNNRTSHRNGLPVFVGYLPEQPNLFQVISVRQLYSEQSAEGFSTGPHADQHEWGNSVGGEDIVYIRMRQVNDCRVYASTPADLSVNVSDGVYVIGQTPYYLTATSIDLTSSVPGSGMRWVTVALNASGLYTVEGTAQASVAIGDIPAATDPNDWRIAGVLLKAGDTQITDWPSETRIVDLRLAGARAATSSGTGYLDWESLVVVASTGGDYASITNAEAGRTAGDAILIMPDTYAENVTFTKSGKVQGIVGDHWGTAIRVSGANDTGPMIDADESVSFGRMTFERTLSGGSGEYIGVDCSDSSYLNGLVLCRIDIDGGATGRDLVGLKICGAASLESALFGCYIKIENGGGSSKAIELTGGTVIMENVEIIGDVVASADTTLYLRGCRITGDLTGAGGGSSVLYMDGGSYVTGTISNWDTESYQALPDAHHTAFIGLEDNAGAAIAPAADNRIQVTDDGKVNADAAGNTLDLSIDEAQIDHNSLDNLSAGDPHTQYFLLAGETTNAQMHSGASLTFYSDAGITATITILGMGGSISMYDGGIIGGTAGWVFEETPDRVRLFGGYLDLNGIADGLVLDTDADTSISAPTDDQIDIEIAGADDFRFVANEFQILSGSDVYIPDGYIVWDNLDPSQSRGIELGPYSDGGLKVKLVTSQTAGEPIFTVLSTGGTERLRVEHSGEVALTNDLNVTGDIIVSGTVDSIDLQEALVYGTGNKAEMPMSLVYDDFASVTVNATRLRWRGTSDGGVRFSFYLPTSKGSLALNIDQLRYYLHNASGTQYVTRILMYGANSDGTHSVMFDNQTDDTGTGFRTIDLTSGNDTNLSSTDISSYNYIMIYFNVTSTSSDNIPEFGFPLLRFWYA